MSTTISPGTNDAILLMDDVARMLQMDAHRDFTLVCEDQSFPVHKFVLLARSPVFCAMLKHDMQESKTASAQVTDCSPQALKLVIQWMYSGKLDLQSVWGSDGRKPPRACRTYAVGDVVTAVWKGSSRPYENVTVVSYDEVKDTYHLR